MKKALKILGALFALVLVAIIVIPFVIDVDKYRPQAEKAVNEQINGKLTLGKLSLSLWGQIKVQVAGLKLVDNAGKTLVSVNDAWFHVPFSSIFGGAPLLTLGMKNPEIFVVRDREGKINFLKLMKPGAKEPGQPAAAASPTPAEKNEKKGPTEVPSMVARARLGARIENALVSFKDEKGALSTQVKDLNLVAKDLSLSRPSEVELWADLDTRVGGENGAAPTTVKGPARLTLESEFAGGGTDRLAAQAKVNLNDLEISVPGAFHKAKGIAANAEGKFLVSPEEAKIEKLEVRFHNAVVTSTGAVKNLNAKKEIQFSAKSNDIQLKDWVELLPALKDYDLGGVARFDASASGPEDKLDYAANLAVNALTAKSPGLKAQPQFDATVNVATNRLEKLLLTMKAPGNDLKVAGKIVGFDKPVADFDITSTGMDLDQLVDFQAGAAKKGAAKKSEGGGEAGKGEAEPAAKTAQKGGAGADFDALLNPLRTNPVTSKMVANINVNMAFLKAYNVKMSNIVSKMTMRDLVAAIDSFSMKLWDGSIKMNASTNLKPRMPTYRFGADLAGLKLEQAAGSQLDFIKNTVVGTAFFKMDGSGESFNPEPAKQRLKAKGTMRIENAKFTTIDVAKMTAEALGKAIDKVGDKVPAVKGKSVKVPERESRYDVISSDFTIENGKFTAPNFATKAAQNSGIDLKGHTQAGFIDYGLKADWLVIDTFNMTKAKDIEVNVGGSSVPHVLAEGNDPVKFPVSVGGSLTAPTYSYAQVPEYLASVALKNTTQAVAGRAKSEVQKKVQEAVGKNAPPQAKKALEGIGKKLFGH